MDYEEIKEILKRNKLFIDADVEFFGRTMEGMNLEKTAEALLKLEIQAKNLQIIIDELEKEFNFINGK